MVEVVKYDYIYINADCEVLGRLSDVDYGNDDNSGVLLGRCRDFHIANQLADYFKPKVVYGVKYSERISQP